jgi:hypothetical protein
MSAAIRPGQSGMLKKLSTKGETEVFKQISPVADRYRSAIYRKMRVADVVDKKRLNAGSLHPAELESDHRERS